MMHAVARLVDELVEQGKVPSASVVVRVEGREVLHHTAGLARLDPARRAAEDQPYDLASVTKALAGATVTASLIEEGRLALDTPVARHVPDVDPRVTLRHLLTHASGLPAWRPLYEEAHDAWGLAEVRRALLRSARQTPLDAAPGERHCYSDLGFLTLLALIEEVGQSSLDVLFHTRVMDPADVEDFRWGWPAAAATEKCPVRGVLVEGTVHDLNCAALGGVSTHAGLFAPARAVAMLADRLLHATLDPQRFPGLPGRATRLLWETRGPGSHRAGWDGISGGYSSTGRYFPPDSVGHLGYTGTSVWIAPSRRAVVVLLTNRVHPVDERETIRQIRPLVHDAIAEALGWGL